MGCVGSSLDFSRSWQVGLGRIMAGWPVALAVCLTSEVGHVESPGLRAERAGATDPMFSFLRIGTLRPGQPGW
jgi:hypothetical protein